MPAFNRGQAPSPQAHSSLNERHVSPVAGLYLGYFLAGTRGRNLAFSPRCTFATFVRMDLIGSSPKSDRYAD
ncbi:conserved protein of unknown function [Pseudomonas mediterranea]